MEKNEKTKKTRKISPWTIVLLFCIVIFLLCNYVFIFNYNLIYYPPASAFLPSHLAALGYYFLISLGLIILAVILKIAYKNTVRLWAIILTCILLPIMIYILNYNTLKPGGIFSFTVSRGSPLYFIVDHDFNFDGMNDELYHNLYEKREYSQRHGGHFNDEIIDYIEQKNIGTGATLSGGFCDYEYENQIIEVHLNKNRVELESISVTVAFNDPKYLENLTFCFEDTNEQIEYTVTGEKTVEFVFNAEQCKTFQNASEKEYIEIRVKYRTKV